jgi:hypothetical protein
MAARIIGGEIACGCETAQDIGINWKPEYGGTKTPRGILNPRSHLPKMN